MYKSCLKNLSSIYKCIFSCCCFYVDDDENENDIIENEIYNHDEKNNNYMRFSIYEMEKKDLIYHHDVEVNNEKSLKEQIERNNNTKKIINKIENTDWDIMDNEDKELRETKIKRQ